MEETTMNDNKIYEAIFMAVAEFIYKVLVVFGYEYVDGQIVKVEK